MTNWHWPVLKLTFKLGWIIWGLYFAVLETYALLSRRSDATLSANIRMLRFDTIGRPLVLTAWCWLTVHLILRPRWNTTASWRDGVAIALGVLAAYWELTRK